MSLLRSCRVLIEFTLTHWSVDYVRLVVSFDSYGLCSLILAV